MRFRKTPVLFAVLALICWLIAPAFAVVSDEFTGKLDTELVPAGEELEQIVLRPLRDRSKIKFSTPPEAGDKITAGRIFSPITEKSAILILLVEPEQGLPYMYVDLDMDSAMSDKERFPLEKSSDSGIAGTVVRLPLTGSPFQSFPIRLSYYKNYTTDTMQEGDRLVMQTTLAFARGQVDIKGKKTLVQYAFNAKTKKISATSGILGMDCDGDGVIDMDRISPESAEAHDENIVFHLGDLYVSTKKVDVEKNLIVIQTHSSSDYKRVELRMGAELPDFNFFDLNGKKRKLSEFKGKYLLIDFWGSWCGPCRQELPYLKMAYSRFQARGFEILGMDTDENPNQVKAFLKLNDLNWTQATLDSIRDVIRHYRIYSFPTTLLLGPDGKIISLGQTQKGQPDLRGRDLLKSLDQMLPP